MSTLRNLFILLLFVLSVKFSSAQCCGNGICEPGENPTNCPYDCAAGSFNCGNTIGSFFTSPTWPVSSATAQSNGWCYTLTPPYPAQVCFEYRVPNVGDSASVSFSINACGGSTVNQSNYPPFGGCNNAGYSSSTISGVSTYDNNCNLVSNAITTGGPGCYNPGDIITVCLDINPATTCPQIIICPVIDCGATNCATTPTPIGCPPFNLSDSTYIDPCDSTSGYAVVTPDCGSHFSYLWDDPMAQTDSFATGLTPGTYNVTVTNTAFNCDTTITVTVDTVPAPSDPSWNNSDTVCEAAGSINLNALITGDTGGNWYGTGVTGSTFDPTGLSGNIPITYAVGIINCPDSLTQNIFVQPDVDPSLTQPNDTICEANGPINLNNYVNGTPGGNWSGTNVTGSTFDPTGLNGNIVLTYTVGTSPCTESSTITINIQQNVDPSLSSASNTVCEADGLVNLNSFIVGTSGGTWSGTGVTGNNFDPTGLNGNIVLTYTVGNAPCRETSNLTLNVIPDVDPSLTQPNDTLCNNAGTINLNNYINGTSGGTWSGTNVSGNTFDPTGLNGNITITYSVGSSPCMESDSITINIVPGDTASFNYNSPFCLNDNNPTPFITGTTGGTFSISTPGVLVNTSTGEIDLTSSGAGTFWVYYSTMGNNPICGDIDSVQVTILPDYSITINDSICQGDSILLGGIFQNSNGTYYDSLQTTNGCDSIIETILNVNSLPIITTNNDTSICNGLMVNVSANGGVSYNWNNGLGNGQNHNVSPSSTTTYIVTGTNANGCSDTSSITVTVAPLTLANAGPDQEICDGTTSFTLAANQPTNPGELGTWSTSSNAIINNPNMPNSNGTGLSLGQNIFTWTITSLGCPPSSDTIIINVENCEPAVLIIPNVFTPNGDGMNDFFTIGTTKIVSLNCVIYNRWGQKLYEFNGIKGFWDGRTTAGVEVPDGTYFFLLNAVDEDDEEHFRKGSFSLIR